MTAFFPAPGSEPRHRKESVAHAPPRWVRPAASGLLAATAVLYFWNLTASGYGNTFYAAAVQSGTQSWKAWLFGSLDSGNVLTVDKPPAALWVGTAFARVFGFSSFTVLAPQALMGVASVGLLYLTVKRTSGPVAGLLAGAILAVTPVAALMFRFNNPDALLVLLMVAGAYFVVRATEKASPGWLALAGAAIGVGFLTKMMQAFLVLPGLALAVLVAMPGGFWSRIGKLLTAGLAVLVSAGWYVALVQVWPANARPYIGGSTDNSLWDLAVGYNGPGRVLGDKSRQHAGSAHVAVHAQAPQFGGMAHGGTGLLRLLQNLPATEFAWLVPAAVIGLLAGLWATRRAPRTDPARAALILWGGWLAGTCWCSAI